MTEPTLAQQLRAIAAQAETAANKLEVPVSGALQAQLSWCNAALIDSARQFDAEIEQLQADLGAEIAQLQADLGAAREGCKRTERLLAEEQQLRAALKRDFNDLQATYKMITVERGNLAGSADARLREINALRTQMQLAEEKNSRDGDTAADDEIQNLRQANAHLSTRVNQLVEVHRRRANLLDDAVRTKEIIAAERDSLRTAHADQAAEIHRLKAIIAAVASTISEA